MNFSLYTVRDANVHDIELIRTLCAQVWPATYAPILDKGQLDYMMEWMYSPATNIAETNTIIFINFMCYPRFREKEPVAFFYLPYKIK